MVKLSKILSLQDRNKVCGIRDQKPWVRAGCGVRDHNLSHFWDQGLEFSLQNLVSLKQNTLRYDSENDLVAERASHFIWLKRDNKVWL